MTIPTPLRRTARLAGHLGVALSFVAFAGLALGPRTGHYRTLTVLSASMRPTIPEGSVVVVTPVALDRIRVGDVLTYRIPVEDRRVVTHRVIEISHAGSHPVIRTKGDASGAPDPWTARLSEGSAWRVRTSLPWAGYASHALGHSVVRRINVLVLPAGLALWSLAELWGGRRDDEHDDHLGDVHDVATVAPSSRVRPPVAPALACWGVQSPTCGSRA